MCLQATLVLRTIIRASDCTRLLAHKKFDGTPNTVLELQKLILPQLCNAIGGSIDKEDQLSYQG